MRNQEHDKLVVELEFPWYEPPTLLLPVVDETVLDPIPVPKQNTVSNSLC